MADRTNTARWRRYNDNPLIYRLRRCGIDIAAAQEDRRSGWTAYSLDRPEGLPVLNVQTLTLDEAKAKVKEWLRNA